MIRKLFYIILIIAVLQLLNGCGGHMSANGIGLTSGKMLTEISNEARYENYENHIDQHKKLVEERILKKAKVVASTVDIDAEWAGLVRQKVGEVRLNLSLRELNGVGASFDSYSIKVICVHDYFLKTIQEERVGTFYFAEPVMISPFQTEAVVILGNGWLRKNINRMNRLMSSEDVTLEVELNGEDDNGHKLALRATAGTI